METTLDRFGRIVIPKKVRDFFGLKPGTQLRIEESSDAIILRPVHGEPNLIEKDGVLIFTGSSVGDVEEALTHNRNERLMILGGNLEDSV